LRVFKEKKNSNIFFDDQNLIVSVELIKSGKSTLLRCINGRIESGLSDETEIYVSKECPIESCFIVQDQKEHLLMGLTTRESLLYASKIKNQDISELSDDEAFAQRLEGPHISGVRLSKQIEFEHKQFVYKLMTDLALTDCADTLILNCSGGQQKRIVVALELVGYSKPSIMCIDEPTSGLDSNAAEQVKKFHLLECNSKFLSSTIKHSNFNKLLVIEIR
jgi:ABC-type multidrug transport system ATPase subunit